MQKSFNDLLFSSLDEEEDTLENTQICLISQEPLTKTHVKLSCSHQFNYPFIYNEVYNQIHKKPPTEILKLKRFQFKCPYCRNIENGVLPYHENIGIPKLIGVNWPPRHVIKVDNCEYLFASGKRKGLPCNKKCCGKYCLSHQKIIDRQKAKKNSVTKCCAFTKKGTPCSRIAKSSNGKYCLQHFKSIQSNNSNFDFNDKVCIEIPKQGELNQNVVITI
jgi:hypothetical protein